MQLDWIKCGEGSRYCQLELVDLSNVDTKGVYVIWHSASGKVIRIGQGDIKNRLSQHRRDPAILRHRGEATLLVSWAEIPTEVMRLKIERNSITR